jgi:hypothetical protein
MKIPLTIELAIEALEARWWRARRVARLGH